MRQMAACGVKEKAENLLKQLINGRILGVFAHRAKKPSDVREKVNAAQVSREKVESGPICQAVARDLDIIDEIWSFRFAFGLQLSTI